MSLDAFQDREDRRAEDDARINKPKTRKVLVRNERGEMVERGTCVTTRFKAE